MKVSIDQKGVDAVNSIAERVRALNPSARKNNSILINQVVIEFAHAALPAQINAIASRVTTPKGRRRALMKMVQSLAENADEDSLKILEKKLSKMNSSTESKAEKSA